MIRPLGRILIVVLLVAAAAGAGWWFTRIDPASYANAGLESLRLQNRLSVMRAKFVAVQTRQQIAYLMFTAQRTLIVPGEIGYELDLSKLRDRDVRWDAASRTMRVTAPAIEISEPEVDLLGVRAFDSGRVARWVSNADAQLDAATKQAALGDLRRQAAAPAMLKMARDAARTAIRANFALPLKAAGLDAAVEVRFADEPVPRGAERMDYSRSLEDVYRNGAGGAG